MGAADEGRIDTVRLLLEIGADTDLQDAVCFAVRICARVCVCVCVCVRVCLLVIG